MANKDYPENRRTYLPCWFNAQNIHVATALLNQGFTYTGLLEDNDESDYTEKIIGAWAISSRCSDNCLLAVCDGAVFTLDLDGESLLELRWSSTRKLLRKTWKNYAPIINHTQLELFAA
ncbi:hypothetical protein VB713_12430 [Anabaena cylindrica UHCC 0172]|uniref:hypothetical protein n=1 Tax=Anabaena cylindrica TaxID=1165 RepID=UPI002B20EFA6|nr:hypothetical protein [Anabaena cylindrica]MEA5551779.1 hypothetical protein [Anabaena cylindrica UHCC 0172]